MVASVVFILLLDHLPDHPHNQVIKTIPFPFLDYQDHITRQQCDVSIADTLVQFASKQLSTYIQPYWRNESGLIRNGGNYTEIVGDSEETEEKNAFERFVGNEMSEQLSSIEYAQLLQNEMPPQFEIDKENDYKLKLQKSKNFVSKNNQILQKHVNFSTKETFALENTKNVSTKENLALENNKHFSTKQNLSSENRNNLSTTESLASENSKNFSTKDNLTLQYTKIFNSKQNLAVQKSKNFSTKKDASNPNDPQNSRDINIDVSNDRRSDNYAGINSSDSNNDIINSSNHYNSYNTSNIAHNDISFNNSIKNKHSNVDKSENNIVINSDTDNKNENYENVNAISNTNATKEYSTTELYIGNTEKAVSFPKSASYLVAIFETLANVTAQTCAGTLVAPEWVLTAASCVNVLGNLYNTLEYTEHSSYTVIVNASNPILDGSAHNVTEILLHPRPPTPLESSVPVGTAQPTLALLRIEPRVEIDELKIGIVKIEGEAVMVYGWALVKNEYGHEELRATTFPAVTLPPLQCNLLGHSDNDAICLTVTGDTSGSDIQMTSDVRYQMTSGGPVVGLSADGPRLLALASTDSPAPMTAAPLAKHARWLGAILCA